MLSATGWWFILALWAPIYGSILKIEFVQPLAALLGWKDGRRLLRHGRRHVRRLDHRHRLTTGLVALGMAGYARIQRWCLYIGLAALALMFVLMPISSQTNFKAAFDREAQSLFGVSNAYQATIDVEATVDGGCVPALDPLGFGPGHPGCWSRSCCSSCCTRTGAQRSTARSAGPATSARS